VIPGVIRLKAEGFPLKDGGEDLLAFTAALALAYCARPEVFPIFRRIALEVCGDDDQERAHAMRTLTPEVLGGIVDSFVRGAIQ